jgi:MFS family permease
MRGSRIFLTGQAVSQLGDGLALLAIPLLVLRLTQSPVAAVLASLPASAGYLAAGLPAGLLADRMSPRLVLACGDAIRAALFLALYAVSGTRAAPPALILSLAFAAGMVTVFSDTALALVVRDVFTGPRLIPANSFLESATQLGLVLGPGGAGLLAAAGLLRASLLIDAVTFLVSLACLAGLRASYPASPRPRPRPRSRRPALTWRTARAELAEGIRQVAGTRLLLTLLVFQIALNLGLGADKLLIFLLRSTLALSPWHVGLVISTGGLGGLLGAAGTSWLARRLGPLHVIAFCCAVSGAALLLLGTAFSAPVALAANVLYTWAIVAASVTNRSLRQALVPRPLLGRVMASWRLSTQAVTLAGGLLAGAAAALAGSPRPVFAAAGVLTLLTVATTWLAALRHEQLPPGLLTAPGPVPPPPACSGTGAR